MSSEYKAKTLMTCEKIRNKIMRHKKKSLFFILFLIVVLIKYLTYPGIYMKMPGVLLAIDTRGDIVYYDLNEDNSWQVLDAPKDGYNIIYKLHEQVYVVTFGFRELYNNLSTIYKVEDKKVESLFPIHTEDITYNIKQQNKPYISGILSSQDGKKFLFRSRSYGTIIHKDKEGKYKTVRFFMFDRDTGGITEFDDDGYYETAKDFGYSDMEIFDSMGSLIETTQNIKNKYMQKFFGKEGLDESTWYVGNIDENRILLQSHKKGERGVKIYEYNAKTKEMTYKISASKYWFSFSLSPDKKYAVVAQGKMNYGTFASVVRQHDYVSIIDMETFQEVKRLPAGNIFKKIKTREHIVWTEK